jgi:hypothetical protein
MYRRGCMPVVLRSCGLLYWNATCRSQRQRIYRVVVALVHCVRYLHTNY